MGINRTHTSRHDHAAQLVHDQHVQRRGGRTEALLEDLQDGLHGLGRVLESHGQVTQGQDGVGGDESRLPVKQLKHLHSFSSPFSVLISVR